jgi:hypothetical protein
MRALVTAVLAVAPLEDAMLRCVRLSIIAGETVSTIRAGAAVRMTVVTTVDTARAYREVVNVAAEHGYAPREISLDRCRHRNVAGPPSYGLEHLEIYHASVLALEIFQCLQHLVGSQSPIACSSAGGQPGVQLSEWRENLLKRSWINNVEPMLAPLVLELSPIIEIGNHLRQVD